MREIIPNLKAARQSILQKILHRNLAYATFSFDKKAQSRYSYSLEKVIPESLRTVTAIFEDIPESVSAQNKTDRETSKKEATLNALEQIVGTFEGHGEGKIFRLIANIDLFEKIDDLLAESSVIISKDTLKKIAKLFQKNLNELSQYPEEFLRESLQNSKFDQQTKVIKDLNELISKLIKISFDAGLPKRQIIALDEIIVYLLKSVTKVLKVLPVKQFQNEIKEFLNLVNHYNNVDLVDSLGLDVIKSWSERNPVLAFLIIQSQWQYLSANYIINMLKYYAGRESTKYGDKIVSGMDAVNHIARTLLLTNPEFKKKLQSSTVMEGLPYHCDLWDLIDLSDLGTRMKLKADYFGVDRFLRRAEEEKFDMRTVPISSQDLFNWAKADLRFAKIILRTQGGRFSEQQMVDLFFEFSKKVSVTHERKRTSGDYEKVRISGLEAVELIVDKFITPQDRDRLIQSNEVMSQIKVYKNIYKSLCQQDIQRFSQRLMSLPVTDCGEELNWLFAWAKERKLNLMAWVGTETLVQWAKAEISFANKIIESQWLHLSARDMVNILIHHKNKEEDVNFLVTELVLGNKDFCDKLTSSKYAMKNLKQFSYVYAELSKRKPNGDEHGLPKIHPPVLVLNGSRRNSINEKPISHSEVEGRCDENTLPTLLPMPGH